MEIETLRQTVREVLEHQNLMLSWWTYLLFGIVTAVSAYLGAYLKKKGEAFATKEDFDSLLEQTKKTNQATEEIKQAVARRSTFESQVLLDRYKLVTSMHAKITNISTDLNRVRNGATLPDFIRDGDIVPLTQVFETLFANRWLIGGRFYQVLFEQSNILLKVANEQDPEHLKHLWANWEKQREEFGRAMTEIFQLDQITL